MDINEGKKKIDHIKKIITKLDNQIPIREVRDGCGLRFCFTGLSSTNNNWVPAIIEVYASHSHYGSRSASNDMCMLLGQYIEKSLSALENEIINKAKEIATNDLKEIAAYLENQALEILKLAKEY